MPGNNLFRGFTRSQRLVDSSSTYYSYDARDRLTNQTEIIAVTKYSILYAYDKASNIVMLTYPNDYKLNYSYDFLNRISAVGSFANFTYTLDNKIGTITYGSGVKTAYTYDSRDMPTRILTTSGSAKLLDLNYTYDGAGNVLSIGTEKYSYDSLNRISSGNSSWGTVTYSYDPNGNMLKLSQNGVETAYGYGTNNKLLTAGAATLSYNADGDLIKDVNGSTTFNYNYDYENRLTSVVKNGATLQNNTYNADGQRVKSVAGSSSQVFLYEGSSMLESVSNSTSDSFYANGLLISEISGASTYYYQEDALGSTRLVTTSSASVVFSSNYLPFGSSYAQSGSFSTAFRYTGKYEDYATTGLYYFGARYYDPAISRFITEDTFMGTSFNPMSLNRYVYAEDNPERYTDPTGHMIYVPGIGGMGINGKAVGQQATQILAERAAYERWLGTPEGIAYEQLMEESSSSTGSWSSSKSELANQRAESHSTMELMLQPQYEDTYSQSSFGCVGTTVPPGSVCGTSSEAGAILVTVGFFGLAAGATIVAVIFPPSLPVTGAVAVGSFGAGTGASYYDYEEGPNATPQGALNAGEEAWPDAAQFVVEHLDNLFSFGGIIPQI